MKTTYVLKKYRAIADLVPLTSMEPPGWLLTRINVPHQHRGCGVGTQLLLEVLKDADVEQETLYLEPASSGGLLQNELVEWYARHGFVYFVGPVMIRHPRQ